MAKIFMQGFYTEKERLRIENPTAWLYYLEDKTLDNNFIITSSINNILYLQNIGKSPMFLVASGKKYPIETKKRRLLYLKMHFSKQRKTENILKSIIGQILTTKI